MNFRIENKYKIEKDKLFNFYEFLKLNSAKILYPQRKIHSIYFDNQSFSSYNDSIEGIVPRKKIRIRTYPKKVNDKSAINHTLEIKINSAEGKIKNLEKNFDYDRIVRHGYFDSLYGQCLPKVEISYFREYFSLLDFRVTIDKLINYVEFNNQKKIISYDSVIVEVKSNELRSLNHIENKFFFQKTRFSKYTNAIENINNFNNTYIY
jgi:hypothetical protein